MSGRGEEHPAREERVGEAVAWYYQAAEAGGAPDPAAFLARFPDVRPELESFLADKGAFERAAGPPAAARPDPDATLPPSAFSGTDTVSLRPPADPGGTVAHTGAGADAALGSVRYFGDYELLGELARGGMGVVFRARQVSLNREVALKMILAGQLASAGDVARFRAEAEAAANLDHPHVLPVYEVGEHHGQQYFAMKLVPGGSLAGKVAALVDDPKAAVAVLAPVCRAVDFAHRRGVLHRDLKPGNVLLDADGTPYVTDFGLAKRVGGDSGLTQSGAIVGTPSYMAPEQARAEKQLTTAADVYALGAILYELLAGRPPFRGASVLDTVLQVLEREPDHPRAVNPAADRDLSVVALKCLAKDPARRYESAGALADDLDRWARGEPILARPVGAGERAAKWVRRNPVVAVLLAVVGLTLTAGASVSAYYGIQAADRARAESLARTAADTAAAAAGAAEQRALRERDSAIHQRYVADCARFQIAWEQGDYGRLDELLNRWLPKPDLPDPRGWEWHYLRGQCDARMTVLVGHRAQVNAVSWHPHGRLAASASSDGVVKVWNAETRECVRDCVGHTGEVDGVAWCPDGRRLASCGSDGAVVVWTADRGEVRFRIERAHDGERVEAVDWSPDGRRLASAGVDGKVRVWCGETGRPLRTLDSGGNNHARVRWSHDGRSLAASREGRVTVWDTETWREAHQWQQDGTIGESLAWSPDDQSLALGFLSAGVWDVRSGKATVPLTGHDGWMLSLAWGRQGRLASASRDQTVGVWDPHGGTSLRTLRMHTGVVLAVAWNPDGERLASAGADGTVRVYAWDPQPAASRLVVRGTGAGSRCVGLSWGPQDSLVVVRPDHVTSWSPAGAAFEYRLAIEPGGVVGSAASADGTRVALRTAGGECALVDVVRGRTTARYPMPLGPGDTTAWCLGFSTTGNLLAGGASFSHIQVWDAETGHRVATHSGFGHGTFGLDWHPRLDRFAVGGQPSQVHVVDRAAGPRRQTDHGMAEIYQVKYSPDGAWLAAGGLEGQVVISDAETGTRRHTLRGHAQAVLALAWTADGRRLASAGADRTIRLWDVETGELLLVLRGHGGQVEALAWDRESAKLATGDALGQVRLWAAGAGPRRPAAEKAPREPLERRRWVGHTGTVRDIAVSADGGLAVSCGGWPNGDGTVRVWDVAAGKEVRQLRGHKEHISAVRFVGQGRQVMGVGFDRVLRLWDADTGELVRVFPEHTGRGHALDISPDGLTAVTGADGRAVWSWDVKTGMRTKAWRVPPAGEHRVLALAISADGRRVIAGGDHEALLHVELETGRVLRRFAHGSGIETAVLSPDGKFAVSAGFDGRVVQWDLQTGEQIREFPGHVGWAQHVSFSPDGRLLATAGQDGTIRLWEFATGEELHVYRAHSEPVWAVRFTPDGRHILSGGGGDGDFDIRVLAVPEKPDGAMR